MLFTATTTEAPTTTTEAPTTTTEVPSTTTETSAPSQTCDIVFNFTDPNGVYLKSACIYTQERAYADAPSACASLNMQLLIVDDPIIQSELQSDLANLFGIRGGSILWVNGRNQSGQWLTNDNEDGVQPLWDGIDWIDNGQSYGECLAIGSFSEPFRFQGYDCSNAMWSICEFTYSTPPPTEAPATTIEAPGKVL